MKAAVEAQEGIPAEEQRLAFAGVSLEDEHLVAEVHRARRSSVVDVDFFNDGYFRTIKNVFSMETIDFSSIFTGNQLKIYENS